MKRRCAIAICYFFFFCQGSQATTERFIQHYSAGLQTAHARDPILRMRAFAKAAVGSETEVEKCTDWDCIFAASSRAQKTPLYAYALYHLADLACKQNRYKETLNLLNLIGDTEVALLRKISLLKGKALQFLHDSGVAKHFQAHAAQYTDAESLYFSAAALDLAGDKQNALALALKVLEKPEADFAFAQSGLIVRNLLGSKVFSLGDAMVKIRLMEALRVAKDKTTALKILRDLDKLKLSDEAEQLFSHYGSRLTIDKNDFSFVTRRFNELDANNEKAVLDVCERLLKKKNFRLVDTLFVKASTKGMLQCRLRLAQRRSQYDSSSRVLAAEYIDKHDGDSTLAERIFLRSCIDKTVDVDCLENLRQLSQEKSIGAGARYYLIREYTKRALHDKVLPLYEEIAKHYADDFYFYRLLELSAKSPKGKSGNRILSALLTGNLHEAESTSTLSILNNLEQRITKETGRLEGTKKTAHYLLAADSRDEMRELIRGETKLSTYENLIALGITAQKSDIALFGVKQWLRENKLRPFFYEIPPRLRELLYPQSFSAHVKKYAGKHDIEVAEVMALIRQESQFFPAALSTAHAQGLMQLLPATAKLVAKKENLENYDLFSAEDNIRLGIAFMRDIKNNYSANFTGLAIAYNAGPGRYTQWKKKLSLDEDFFIEEIPFQETYHYVRVLFIDRAKYRALLQ